MSYLHTFSSLCTGGFLYLAYQHAGGLYLLFLVAVLAVVAAVIEWVAT